MYHRLLNPLSSHSFFMFGARGTGKSTLIHYLKKQLKPILWVDLLDLEIERTLLAKPETLEQWIGRTPPKGAWVVIDEIQKVPALLNLVHQLIEKRKIKFALTGSSARKLKRGGVNLLGGRALEYHLFPLTYLELGADFELMGSLQYGQLPLVCAAKTADEKRALLRSYVSTYLKEEIREEQLVRKIEPFIRFLEVAGQQNGQILNIAGIARDSGVDSKAVERYFEILTDTLLGFELPPFHRSVRKRQSQQSKYYLFDTGVARALAGHLTVDLLPSTSAYGRAFEHLMILEIYRLAHYRQKDFRFSYLRTKDDLEVDLIIERPGKPLALVEIKSSERVSDIEINRLTTLKKDLAPCEVFVLSREKFVRELPHATIYPWVEGIAAIFDGQKS